MDNKIDLDEIVMLNSVLRVFTGVVRDELRTCMKEVARQTLVLASEKADIDYNTVGEESGTTILVDKQSILDVIDLVV